MSGDESYGEPVREPLTAPATEEYLSDKYLDEVYKLARMLAPDRLGFLYDRWSGADNTGSSRVHECADPGSRGTWKSFGMFDETKKKEIDKLKGLDIGAMSKMVDRLKKIGQGTGQIDGLMKKAAGDLDQGWNGAASRAALKKYDEFANISRDYAGSVQHVGTALGAAADSLKKAIDKVAAFARDGGIGDKFMRKFDHLGGEGEDQGTKRGDWSSALDQLDQALRNGVEVDGAFLGAKGWQRAESPLTAGGDVVDGSSFPEVAALAGSVAQYSGKSGIAPGPGLTRALREVAGFCDLGDGGADTTWADARSREMDEFAASYYAAASGLKSVVENANKAVREVFSTLETELGRAKDNPYAALEPPKEQPAEHKGPDDGGGPKNTGGPSEKPPQTGGDSGTTTTASANGGGPGTGPGQPPQQPPAPPAAAATPAMPAMPAMPKPEDLQAGQTGPSADPGPGDRTPDPGAAADKPETVKIKEPGGRGLELTTPDDKGHMKLSVDDGSGQPKSYDVDFGKGSAPGGAPGPGGAEGSGGAQPVHADQSGHAEIHDGKTTISLDKAPDSDQVKVTVDDGSGKPASYTIESTEGTGTDPAGQHGDPTGGGSPDGMSPAGGASPPGDGPAGGDGSPGEPPPNAESATAPGSAAEPSMPEASDPGTGASPAVEHTPAAEHTPTAEPAAASAGAAPGIQHASGDLGGAAPAGGAEHPAAASHEPIPGQTTTANAMDGGFGAGVPGMGGGAEQPMQPGGMSGADPNMAGDGNQDGGYGAGVGDAHTQQAGGPGGPGVGGPGGHPGGHPEGQSGDQGGAMGGMPMMGGMGGGGGGGDQERGASSWSTEGNLFDEVGESVADLASDLFGPFDRR
ncbi:hypothetical protein [Sciscionella sediminilitoris]|uniref:hypothetical protein n=1 Tax=Sciscionella sediminilitoris TaxID=1445613 RepID=UPI00056C1F78|nr:hypothetical protein [Sciscionella sp. SE31]